MFPRCLFRTTLLTDAAHHAAPHRSFVTTHRSLRVTSSCIQKQFRNLSNKSDIEEVEPKLPEQKRTVRSKFRSGHLESIQYPHQKYYFPVQPTEATPEVEAMEKESSEKLSHAGLGPEPSYQNVVGGYNVFHYDHEFQCELTDNPRGGMLPGFQLAYETWGELNAEKDNAILLFTGLSASSHAKSHELNENPGWWEQFIGPGLALDTDKFHVICVNLLGGCYGSSGPSSINPIDDKPFALSFPLVTVADMVRTQFKLLEHLGIHTVEATVGSSMGGMLSLAAAAMYPERVKKVVSISAACRAHPTAIALRYMQRQILMADPHWNGGNYYDGPFPVIGTKHARELATISYRSGPEWMQRFGRKLTPKGPGGRRTSLLPDFLIEAYLDYQGNKWCMQYDPNSLLYISKAMDLFDMTGTEVTMSQSGAINQIQCPVLVMGVQSDILFPITQQRELVEFLQDAGNSEISYYELNAMYGHDTFLIDVPGITGALKGHL
eukprot:m.343062 g.343062  ORF g.343062 m.343062 type:complete len:493 (-) comp22288_c0_seq1:179-1657(-)